MNHQHRDTSSSSEAQDAVGRLFPFQMRAVRLREIRAALSEPDEEEEQEPSIDFSLKGEEKPEMDEGFDASLVLNARYIRIEDEILNLSVTLEGRFVPLVELGTIDEGVVQRFKTRDVIMSLWPYMRETVHHITQRMQVNMPLLPILTPQELSTEE